MNRATSLLNKIYEETLEEMEKDDEPSWAILDEEQIQRVNDLTKNAETQKAVLTVVITSLVKKILDPQQDIRKHQDKMNGGYSGRTLDTNEVTPFLKRNFRRFAMAESGWLTRSLEQPYPYDLDYGGEIRNKEVKDAFLGILHDVEENGGDPNLYLKSIFANLIEKLQTVQEKLKEIDFEEELPIQKIMSMVKEHFETRGASRLPVIAIYSVLDLLVENIERYDKKELLPLKHHTTSDATSGSIGDIEILDNEENYFEAIEIKHNIQIDEELVKDVYDKFRDVPINRYLILTTAEPNVRPMEEKRVLSKIEEIHEDHGCQLITNGVIPTLKYYMRLLKKPSKFIESYTKYLEKDYESNTDVKDHHIDSWRDILEKSGVEIE